MNIKSMTGVGVALAMVGCATTPMTDPQLDTAHHMVQSAESDPNVALYAALDLQKAKQELQLADDAAARHDRAGVEQSAYLAAQTARLATLEASAKADDARVAAGQAERDRIQLSARTRDVDAATQARDQEAQKAAALQAEVDALEAKPTDRGLVLTLGDVLFDSGQATLTSGAARNLDGLVQFLTDHADRRIEIDGYTDGVGTDSFNQDLSQRRADAVKSTLVDRGIDPSRITTQGFGKEFALASNADPAGRQRNRRVEVVIGGDNGAAVTARSRY